MKHSRLQVVLLASAFIYCSGFVLQEWKKAELKDVSERSASDPGRLGATPSSPRPNCTDSRGGKHADGDWCLVFFVQERC
uniref:Putative secreted protein n=1 Tax=Rhipicephalus microplus TaxID=6941 RepID=A0A6G5A2W2_RHIMP